MNSDRDHLDLNLHPLISFHSPPIVLPGAPRIPLNPVVRGSRLGSILGPLFGTLFFASWNALGAVRGRKKLTLNGSWPLQEEFQERCRIDLGPKNC